MRRKRVVQTVATALTFIPATEKFETQTTQRQACIAAHKPARTSQRARCTSSRRRILGRRKCGAESARALLPRAHACKQTHKSTVARTQTRKHELQEQTSGTAQRAKSAARNLRCGKSVRSRKQLCL